MRPVFAGAALLALIGVAVPLAAPAGAQVRLGDFRITGSATATSDYRFRGISQSNGDPALQALLSADHVSGFYAGLFASTLSDDPSPGEIELSAFAGYTREIASGTNLDVGLQFYGFPNNGSLTDASYFEPYASVAHTLGPVTAAIGAAYAPEQEALADRDSLYVHGDLRGGLPFSPVQFTARLGYTSGPARFAPWSDYLDWRIGAEYKTGPATLALDYVDNDLPDVANAEPALVASVSLGF